MKKDLKQLREEQRQAEAATTPPVLDPNNLSSKDAEKMEKSNGMNLEKQHTEKDVSGKNCKAEDSEEDMPEIKETGAECKTAESEDMEEYDLESYDLAALTGMSDMGGDVADPLPDPSSLENSNGMNLEKQHGKPGISQGEDYGGDTKIPMEDDDEESGMSEAAAWFERTVAAGLVDVGLQDLPIADQTEAVESLRSAGYSTGADFVETLTTSAFDKMQTSLVPIYEEAVRVVAAIEEQDADAQKKIASLRRGGKREVAASLQQDLREAREKDILEADLDYEPPAWLEKLAQAFIKKPEQKRTSRKPVKANRRPAAPARTPAAKPASVQANAQFQNPLRHAYLATAQAVHRLVEEGSVKTAARLVTGQVSDDAVEAAKTLHDLMDRNQVNRSVNMVQALRKASYVNPDLKPIKIDPTQPSHEGLGTRHLGPLPDAGMSYGMPEEEVRKAMSILECDVNGLKWVAGLPRTAENALDTDGKVEVYAGLDEDAKKTVMSFDEAKQYIANKTPRQAVLLMNPFEIGKVEVEDTMAILQASATEDPFYTVFVGGMPVAEVHLQDQQDPDAYRSVFADAEVYGNGVRESMAKFGVGDTLQNLNARYFASVYDRSEEITRIRADAAKIAQEEIRAEVDKRVGEFGELMMLAHEAIRKNVYPIDDPLKYAMYERLKEAGLREASIGTVIEESINMPLRVAEDKEPVSALSMYMQVLMAKAVEFQEMSPEALQHVAQTIIGAPVRHRDYGTEVEPAGPQSLMDRLASASQTFTNVGGPVNGDDEIPAHRGTRTGAAVREGFKRNLGIGSKYRNKE